MPFATLLLLTSTLAGPAVSAQRAVTPAQQTVPPPRLGIGGSITASNFGAAGDVRYWFTEHFGAQMSAGWYQSSYQTPSGDHASTMHAAPSVIYLIGSTDPTREVSIRPYIGGGASFVRSTQPFVGPNGRIILSENSGTGMQAFGGAELMFKDAPRFALSGELVYYRLPDRVGSTSLDGLNYVIAVHFYLK
jgi:hypothetical protein